MSHSEFSKNDDSSFLIDVSVQLFIKTVDCDGEVNDFFTSPFIFTIRVPHGNSLIRTKGTLSLSILNESLWYLPNRAY